MKKSSQENTDTETKNNSSFKRLLKPSLIVIIVFFISFSLYFLFRFFPNKSHNTNSTNVEAIASTPTPTVTNNVLMIQTESVTNTETPKETASVIDTNKLVFDELKEDEYGYLNDTNNDRRYMLFTYKNERYLSDENFGITKLNSNGKGAQWFNKRTKSHFKNYYDYGYCKIFLCDSKWLYYTKRYIGGGSGEGIFDPNYDILGKIKLDGTKREEFPEIRTHFPTVYNEWIYFIKITDYFSYTPGYIYKVKKDGSNLTQVKTSKKCNIFDIQGGIIYYSDTYENGSNKDDRSPKVSSLNLKTGKEIIDFISFEDFRKENAKFNDCATGKLLY